MKISTMTNFFYENRPDGRGYIESVKLTREAGFEYLDFCGCPMQRNATEFNRDDEWEKLSYDLADESAKVGVTFVQSHLPYPKPNTRRESAFDKGCELNDYFIKMTYRCIDISATLGAKWAVVHPVMTEVGADPEKDIAYNLDIYGRYHEYAAKKGMGLAFENMAVLDGVARFGSSADDLIAICNAFGNDHVGICWDFGHGNRVYHDANEQKAQFAKTLPLLRATHVDDNIGDTDLHQLPYVGTVDWNNLVPLMKDCDDVPFNYELKFVGKFPAELKFPAAQFAYRVACHLVSLADK